MIVMTVPRRTLRGGVANFVGTVGPHLAGGVVYFEVGAHDPGETLPVKILNTLADFCRFHWFLARHAGEIALVHLNPSMGHHALFRDGGCLLIARMFRLPVVVLFHGWDPEVVNSIAGLSRIVFTTVFNRAQGFMVLAARSRDDLLKLGVRKPVFLLTTAVADAFCDGVAAGRRAARRAERTTTKLLFLARIERKKGIFETLDSLKLLLDDGRDVQLTVAGDGASLRDAMRHAEQLGLGGRVAFVGHVTGDDKLAAFSSADLFVFPSYTEGMPTNVLEAMAAGLPVITTPVGGLVDFFEESRMGYFVDRPDPELIAARVRLIMDDDIVSGRMAEYNQRYAVSNFRASVVAGNLGKIYSSIAR